MKFKHPEKKWYNWLSLLYVPVCLVLAIITVDLFLAYQAGATDLLRPVLAAIFTLYLGARAVYNLRRVVDFER